MSITEKVERRLLVEGCFSGFSKEELEKATKREPLEGEELLFMPDNTVYAALPESLWDEFHDNGRFVQLPDGRMVNTSNTGEKINCILRVLRVGECGELRLPPGTYAIAAEAGKNNKIIEKIYIQENENVVIGANAFKGCRQLRIIEGVESISERMGGEFEDCPLDSKTKIKLFKNQKIRERENK